MGQPDKKVDVSGCIKRDPIKLPILEISATTISKMGEIRVDKPQNIKITINKISIHT